LEKMGPSYFGDVTVGRRGEFFMNAIPGELLGTSTSGTVGGGKRSGPEGVACPRAL